MKNSTSGHHTYSPKIIHAQSNYAIFIIFFVSINTPHRGVCTKLDICLMSTNKIHNNHSKFPTDEFIDSLLTI